MVWDDVTTTGANYPGTVVPKSFPLRLADGTEVWVHPNATKHMAEAATSSAARGSAANAQVMTQQQIRSFQAAVEQANANGVSLGKMYRLGDWELQFGVRASDELVVVNHARYLG